MSRHIIRLSIQMNIDLIRIHLKDLDEKEKMTMTRIIYQSNKNISPEDLQELFLSVKWASGEHKEKLAKAICNSDTVISAWDGDQLVGLINALDDGIMTAYIHFLLVRPNYQSKGIGKQLVEMIKEIYRDYLRLVLVSYDNQVDFYKRCGFDPGNETTAMFLTSLDN